MTPHSAERPRPTLTLTRGLAGSGKSFWATEQAHSTGCVVIERDMVRRLLNAPHGKAENDVTIVQRTAVSLTLAGGRDVIVSDTCLPDRVVKEWAAFAAECGAAFKVEDFRDVPLSVCLARNTQRPPETRVPEDVIINNYKRYIFGKGF